MLLWYMSCMDWIAIVSRPCDLTQEESNPIQELLRAFCVETEFKPGRYGIPLRKALWAASRLLGRHH